MHTKFLVAKAEGKKSPGKSLKEGLRGFESVRGLIWLRIGASCGILLKR
jgi:hypothetical protein